MKAREFDARRLDVKAFAATSGQMSGEWPITGFDRLCDVLASADGPIEPVQWSARGAAVPVRGGAAEVWLHLRARAVLPLLCQRCLQPCAHELSLDRRFLFVADESTAAELDADVEHDVLVFAKELDLHELVEDEFLLDLPLVPRHDVCPQPLDLPADELESATADHPFAALAGLRRGKA